MRTAQFIEESKASKPEAEGVEKNEKTTPEGKLLGGVTGKGFMPGQSGNPGGRPKGDQFKQLAQQVIEHMGTEQWEQALDGFRKQLFKGNAYAFNVLSDRAYGKLTEKIDLSVEAGIVEKLTAARARVKK